MNRFLRLFAAFRDLETLTADQSHQVEELDTALRTEIRERADSKQAIERLNQAVSLESTKRIAAESIASERRAEIDRLLDQVMELRADLARVNAERLRSLDALNVKLMRDPVPEAAPDMGQYKNQQADKGFTSIVAAARENHRRMDQALIDKFYGKPRIVMNESAHAVTEETAA